ncbi:amidophosphoribosyltransferase [Entomophthora muscae]|uniref:Amidophosphoribosyltransferase n=1 Tax=Entomophthora muscae TaxID=34485 RepID=A0ACC2T4J0_9FUNG|nr:amidophosphoribosyltransferase [Entomophthora muscae]
MCGINAIFLADKSGAASAELCESMSFLQHRGQDAAGIITCGRHGRLYQRKGNGMAREVFDQKDIIDLVGNYGVGHVRYPTAGSSSTSEAQPFYVNSPYGLVLAHNGNLTNSAELKTYLDTNAHRHINTDSDSELLLNILADELQKTGKARTNEEDTFEAIKSVLNICKGGFACLGMVAGFGLIAFRDPNGIRPLVYGTRESKDGLDYGFASESVALECLGFTNIIDVKKGEAIIVTHDKFVSRTLVDDGVFSPCIFEYVYFARPDSIIDGISVYSSRMAMGQALAGKIMRQLGKDGLLDIDVVVPVPETSRVCALEVAKALRLSYREGFVKNRYVGRTFIMPGQEARRKSVRRKLNAMALEFSGKNVLIVDDSIVRGTTSTEIIQMAREAGAKKVFIASAAPPLRYPNVYGIDMPTSRELVAFGRTEAEIAREIRADDVIFQDLDDLVEACRKFNPSITQFETSVFNNCYVTGSITKEYLEHLDSKRNDSALTSQKQEAALEAVGLFNNFGTR